MTILRHKTFVGPTFYFQGGSLNENREVIRSQAEAFVNAIGSENVVSVAEHAMSWGPFSVVVWYRAEAGLPEESAVVEVSNATIGRALRAAQAAKRPPAEGPANQLASAETGKGWWAWLIVLLAGLAALVGWWMD